MLVPFVYAGCALIWGTTWFAIRRCIGPGGYPTLAAAALRFLFAALVLGGIAAAGFARPPPRRDALPWLVCAGVLCAAGYALVYRAEETIPGGLAAVLYGTFPLATAALGAATGTERVRPSALLGSGVALAGVALVFADRFDASRAQATGIGLVLLSVLVSAVYTVIMKRVTRDAHPFAVTLVFLGTAAVVLALAAITVERRAPPWPPPFGPTVALVYLAIFGSVLVFGGYFFLLKRISMMSASLLVLVEPVLALVVDALWERDVVLAGRTYVGIAVTFGGVALGLLAQPRPAGVASS